MELIAIGAAGLLFVVLSAFIVRIKTRQFDERFPPISDSAFLSRCRSGTDPDVALKVRRIVADSLGIEYDRIHPSARFVKDLGAD